MRAPVHQDLEVYQGSAFDYSYTLFDAAGDEVNLTGYAARMAVKRDLRADESAYLSTGADANGGLIALGGVAGTIAISMTAAQTDALDEQDWFFRLVDGEPDLPLDPKICFFYDLELVSPGGVVTRPLQGELTLWRSVTK